MYVTMQENGMLLRIGAFMSYICLLVWQDNKGYAYREYAYREYTVYLLIHMTDTF